MEGVKNIDNTEKVVVVRVDIDYVPKRKDMSKDEKKISFSQKEINNFRSGLLKELSKKDVPNKWF